MKTDIIILNCLEEKNLYNKDFKVIFHALCKATGLTSSEVKKGLKTLINKQKIVLNNNLITKVINEENSQSIEQIIIVDNSSKNLVLGKVVKENSLYIFKPLNTLAKDIILPATPDVLDALNKRVCASVTGTNVNNLKCKIERVFGVVDDPISENIAIAYKNGFSSDFPNAVIKEVEKISQQVTDEDRKNRVNLEHLDFIPCDPKTCKDKDDSIYAEKTDNGYKVYVAIADVSHYVKMGSELDKEAFKRGTSCYLGSDVYPMLPTELSNGICSLNDNESKLALVCIVDIDNNGKMLDYNFKKAVIKVKHSFCYEDMEKVHLCQDGFDEKYKNQKPLVDLLYQITDVLQAKLENRGCLHFENNEPQYVFSKDKKKVEEILISNTERSHIVVEQFMILANEATAQFFLDRNLDTIFRTHTGISFKKLDELNNILSLYGIRYTVQNNNQSVLKLLEIIQSHPAKEFLNYAILRSLSKAKYSAFYQGHFGLASSGYIHFTSPIRRYPDLIAHRLISEFIETKTTSLKSRHIDIMAMHLNNREKMATKAEMESDKYLACVWANDNKGKIFNGHIVGLNENCINVKYNSAIFEIPLFTIKKGKYSNFVLSKDMLSVKNLLGNEKYTLGDKIKFCIEKVDFDNRTVYASFPEEKILDIEREL